jgi:hypothetical protein
MAWPGATTSMFGPRLEKPEIVGSGLAWRTEPTAMTGA